MFDTPTAKILVDAWTCRVVVAGSDRPYQG